MTVTAQDVRDFTGLTSANVDYTLLNNFIAEAEAITQAQVGRFVLSRFAYNSDRPLVHYLRYKPVVEVLSVFLNYEDTEIDASDYTVSLAGGTITFDADVLTDGDEVYVKYVPQVFDTILLYQTAILTFQRIAIRGNIDAGGGERLTMLKEQMASLIEMVQKRPMCRAATGGWKFRQWRRGI
jgi:hypothetical protein